MRIVAPTPENLRACAAALGRGELVGMPTETVYGLAGAAFDAAALAKIFAAKDRPIFDPLIVHLPATGLATPGVIGALAPAQRRAAEALAARFWPGPLTLVLPRGGAVPDLATSGLPTVAVRRPRHPVAQALLEAAGPLAAPSANRFGRISPTTAADVAAELAGRGVDLVLDGGPCAIGVESTIVAVAEDGSLVLLRPGGVPTAELGAPVASAAAGRIAAPGMLATHYAPRKPLALLPAPVAELGVAPAGVPPHAGLLAFAPGAGERFAALTGAAVVVETLDGADLAAAARGLFAALRRLDASAAEALFAEPCPSRAGLGHAIADRLARAAWAKMPR
jgi:L-threonylcarbamoyladenylate synthase